MPDTRPNVNDYTIKVEPWCGNVRPFRAVVTRADGSRVGVTGGCSSTGRATEAARVLIAKDAARGPR